MSGMQAEQKRAELVRASGQEFAVESRVATDGSLWISVEQRRLGDLLAFLKSKGFTHCSAISVTDWPDDGAFELTYHLWSYEDKLLLSVSSWIDRGDATVDSVTPLWGPSAGIHERELHELFGVEFVGNPDLEPLFLENWDGPAPFRKDFDWRAYVRESFYDQGDPHEQGYWD